MPKPCQDEYETVATGSSPRHSISLEYTSAICSPAANTLTSTCRRKDPENGSHCSLANGGDVELPSEPRPHDENDPMVTVRAVGKDENLNDCAINIAGSSNIYHRDESGQVPSTPPPEPVPKDDPIVTVRIMRKKESFKDCAIIVLIGPTGTGKSNFIETMGSKTSGDEKITNIAKDKLDAGTLEVQAYRMDHEHLNIWTRKPIILVDTPGLSDRRKSEMHVLGQIKTWMKVHNVKTVDRLFYMDRISDNRMPRSKTKCLEIFKALCGQEAAKRTIVVTTMWDLMWNERLEKHAAQRFDLLQKKHWKDFLDQGSKIEKFNNTFDAGVKNLRAFGQPSQDVGPGFAFEKDVNMRETEMGRKAFQVLTERYENLKASLQVVQQDIENSKGVENPELDFVLKKQKNEITADLKQISDELQDYSPEYRKFRNDVHAQLDRGSADSFSTTGSGHPESRHNRWKSKLKTRVASGKCSKTKTAASTTLPDISKYVKQQPSRSSEPNSE